MKNSNLAIYKQKAMVETLQRARDLKKQMDEFRPLDKETEGRIMQKFRLDWNYHSNNLEGNSLTYGETKALLLHGITAQGKPLKDHFEVTGHNEAIDWMLEIMHDERPLTEAFVRQMHEILLEKRYQVDAITADGTPTKKWVEVGQYKSTANHVKTKTGEIFYFASPEETPAKMSDLIQWYRDNDATMDPIILAIEFHYKFIRIHPFDDGNGRMARLLMNFILMKHKYPPVIIKTDDKENYFSALRQADAGILEAFVKYVAENLIHSLELMIAGAKGQSIEEPDDVMKELMLLESEIENIASSKKGLKKSHRVVHEFVLTNIVPLVKAIEDKFQPLEKQFVSQDYKVNFITLMGSEYVSINNLSRFEDTFHKIHSKNVSLEQLDFLFSFKTIKKLLDDGSIIYIRLEVKFESQYCSIKVGDSSPPFICSYGSSIPDAANELMSLEVLKLGVNALKSVIETHKD